MICIAAFIVLLVIWLFTPMLRLIGKRDLADTISSLFKKATHCFTRRATFRACDSNFKDDIKDSILSKLIVRHKKLMKPVSMLIEVSSFIIILVTVFSTLTVVKSGLSLYVYGTCNVKTPSSCSLSSTKACSIDSFEETNPVEDWFSDWGEIVSAIPSRVKSWDAKDYKPTNATYINEYSGKKSQKGVALDIFDPGCSVCRESFSNQLNSGFFDHYKTYVIPYVITGSTGDKFKNSRLVASYIEAARIEMKSSSKKISPETVILRNLFTKKTKDGVIYQEAFNGTRGMACSEKETRNILESWLMAAGFTKEEVGSISVNASSEKVKEQLKENENLVSDTLKTKRIPTMIYDNKKHEGLFEDK